VTRGADRVRLPIVDRPSSLRADGRRNQIIPADVRGRFTRGRIALRVVLIAFAVALPLVRIDGRPALFLDVPARRFFLFGQSLNAQDAWLLFFLVTAAGFALVVTTTLLGRVWCGYACPQTVLLEGIFRPVERWIEGSRNTRIARDRGPWTRSRVARKVGKHAAFVLLSSLIAHVVVSYFVSLPSLGAMIAEGPIAHPAAFMWCSAFAVAIYADVAWFREQLCLVVCPYGRLQSALTDRDSLVIGYDVARGEPRGRARDASAGDCVDCKRCVVVCPTGIDIREGLQVDCIGCTQCIDACDEVMDKLGRERGLVRFDSLRGFAGEKRHFWRPRLALYAVLALAGVLAAGLALAHKGAFEATLLRARGAPFSIEDGELRNSFEIHLVNKRDAPSELTIEAIERPRGAEVAIASERVRLGALGSRRVPILVRMPRDRFVRGDRVVLRVESGGESVRTEAMVLGPISERVR
jgi:cytochrome c oxidase accessory protein FixG